MFIDSRYLWSNLMNVDPHLNSPKPSRWEIIHRPIAELTPDLANPRRHSKKQIRQIADSIKAFGFNVPILITRKGEVIAGHGRLLACGELGWTEVPTLASITLPRRKSAPSGLLTTSWWKTPRGTTSCSRSSSKTSR